MTRSLSSSLYRARVLHHRLEPKRHRFSYGLFMFFLDLDELNLLSEHFFLISKNRFGFFEFCDKDHVDFGGKSIREGIKIYLKEQGVLQTPVRVKLLTHLRVFGYQFNPVSFYFCYDAEERPFAAIAEVGNTFGEMKVFLLGPDSFTGGLFEKRIPKMFYVSPFTAPDAGFHFRLHPPGETLEIQINDIESNKGSNKAFFASRLWGRRKSLTDLRLLWYALRFPFLTLQIITAIHLQAFFLWLKKVPYFRKAEHPELQREIRKPGVPL